MPAHPLDESQVDAVLLDGPFDVAGVPVDERQFYLLELLAECGQVGGQHILGNGGAGAQAQLAHVTLGEQVHFEIELLVVSQNLFGMAQQQLPLGGEGNVGTHALKQTGTVFGFELLYVFTDGRLAHIQLFRGFGETEVAGYAAKKL